jgi:hypothetical protein
VRLEEIAGAEGVEDLLPAVRACALKDRDLYERSQRAYVSVVRLALPTLLLANLICFTTN